MNTIYFLLKHIKPIIHYHWIGLRDMLQETLTPQKKYIQTLNFH